MTTWAVLGILDMPSRWEAALAGDAVTESRPTISSEGTIIKLFFIKSSIYQEYVMIKKLILPG